MYPAILCTIVEDLVVSSTSRSLCSETNIRHQASKRRTFPGASSRFNMLSTNLNGVSLQEFTIAKALPLLGRRGSVSLLNVVPLLTLINKGKGFFQKRNDVLPCFLFIAALSWRMIQRSQRMDTSMTWRDASSNGRRSSLSGSFGRHGGWRFLLLWHVESLGGGACSAVEGLCCLGYLWKWNEHWGSPSEFLLRLQEGPKGPKLCGPIPTKKYGFLLRPSICWPAACSTKQNALLYMYKVRSS